MVLRSFWFPARICPSETMLAKCFPNHHHKSFPLLSSAQNLGLSHGSPLASPGYEICGKEERGIDTCTQWSLMMWQNDRFCHGSGDSQVSREEYKVLEHRAGGQALGDLKDIQLAGVLECLAPIAEPDSHYLPVIVELFSNLGDLLTCG